MTPAKPGFREFACVRDDKSTVRVSVRKPTFKEREYADLEYSAKFNAAICNGIPTQTKLLSVLKDQDVIDAATEARITQLATEQQAQEKLVARDKFPNPKDKQDAVDRLEEIQQKLQQANAIVDSFFEHTAETKAAQAQRNFLIACVSEWQEGDDKGKRIWKQVEDLHAEQDAAMMNRVMYEYMMCQRDLPSDWDKITADQANLAKEAEEAERKELEESAADAPPATTLVDPAAVVEAAVVAAAEAA